MCEELRNEKMNKKCIKKLFLVSLFTIYLEPHDARVGITFTFFSSQHFFSSFSNSINRQHCRMSRVSCVHILRAIQLVRCCTENSFIQIRQRKCEEHEMLLDWLRRLLDEIMKRSTIIIISVVGAACGCGRRRKNVFK